MEVHVPDHPVMTWNQFFVHMGVVVLGLLIAVGLEQAVEAVHREHKRTELREALHRDLEQMEQDSYNAYWAMAMEGRWLQTSAIQAAAALDAGKPFIPDTPPKSIFENELIFDAAFRSARASGTLALLPPDEVRAYSEIDTLVDLTEQTSLAAVRASGPMTAQILRFGSPGSAQTHWERAKPVDVEAYIRNVADRIVLAAAALQENQQAYNAARMILSGEHDLQKLHAAEAKPLPPPSSAPKH